MGASFTFVDLGGVRCSHATTYCWQVVSAAQKGRRLAWLCSRLLACRNAYFVHRVYKTFVRPVTVYATANCSPYLRSEVEGLKVHWRRFTKIIVGNKNLTYGKKLDRQRPVTDRPTAVIIRARPK